jgi:periplasmic divalent cation tolerance protein
MVVTTTTSSLRDARRIAGLVVQKRLAACVQYLPIRSVYWWKNRIHRDGECLLVAKTTHRLLRDLVKCIRANHAYDVPEIVAWPVTDGLPAYLDWVGSETRRVR